MKTKEIIEQTDKYYLPVFGRNQIALDHGKGCKLYDVEGKEYTDFLAGIAVNGLGHAHPAIVQAISEQAGKLIHCSNLYYTEIQAKAIKVISEVSGFERVFLCNSGAEANEGALKLVRKYGVAKSTEKFKIISAVHSFHGRTMATLTATGQNHYHEGLNPLPVGYEYVPYGDIVALEEAMDENVCGILLEPIQGEGGVHVPTNEYLLKARALCDKYDALLIFDEIQSGICRSGKWFAWEYSGARPDIMTMAKAIGGGFPMGAFVTTERLAHVFAPGDHGSTFGGNPLSCAAAYASLTTMKAMNLEQVAAETGTYFKMQLEELQKQFPNKIMEVRGKGLLLGMELTKAGAPIVKGCLERGMIINCTADTVLRFVPPLIISKKEIDALMNVLKEVLEEF
ncbi:MAG: aspartate aminotransferase family protein [Acidaminococcaceae bacterium]|nr:aspartate aminotransferase family protein [Acidaminococcaceae bacterium]MDD4721923.1 aspartate aminotransferase family protein [Acidaminococcaceae bacterium]